MHFSLARTGVALVVGAVGFMGAAMGVHADTWRGTAPFCNGSCNRGEQQIGISKSGDGGYCVTGHKVLCHNASQMCESKETKTSCYGVVMICENGYYDPRTTNWHKCTSYGCGACVGISIDSTHPQSTGAGGPVSDVCRPGFVWREAIPSDHVCVPPAGRTQAAQDNAAAAARRVPNGGASGPDTCKPGFVWREVVPSDHVCVTPQVRSAAAADNAAARQRLAPPPIRIVNDTCKQGFVWRDAINDDHICVTPATRDQARADNAHAAERRAPTGGPSGPDTCRPGFVWREVIPSDHVCVIPQVRTAVAIDATQASVRLAH